MADWFDSDTFIRAKDEGYGFDLAPGFWKLVDQKAAEGVIRSSSWVYHELVDEGTDDLAEWTKERKDSGFWVEPDDAVQLNYKKIADWVNGNYQQHRAQVFLAKADAWNIAHAWSDGGRIVTFENPAELNCPQAKIPDVASQFNVHCLNLWKWLRELHVSFDLGKPPGPKRLGMF